MNFLVRGNVIAYEEGGCPLAFLQDVELTGMWLGDTTTFVRTGSLENSSHFAVIVTGNHHSRGESWHYDPCCSFFGWHDWHTDDGNDHLYL